MKKILTGIFILICSFLFAQQPALNNGIDEQHSIKQNGSCYQIGDHELFLMPTAQTMPKGSSYFSDYELFFLNYTVAPTNRTHVGIFTLFPVLNDFLKTITLGVKQNYYKSNTFASAVWASYSPDIKIATIGNVCSLTYNTSSLHLALSSGAELGKEDSVQTIIMAGIKLKNFIAEYTNSKSMITDNNFNGLITVGFRFGGKKISFDIGGIRPLGGNFYPFVAFPFLKATYRIK